MSWNILKKRRGYLERGGKGPQTSGTGEPVSTVAKQRYSDLEFAEKMDEGPVPARSKPAVDTLISKPRIEADPPPTPAPTPAPTPGELADHHDEMAEYHKKFLKPGSEGVPQQGRPSLSREDRSELEPDIDVKRR